MKGGLCLQICVASSLASFDGIARKKITSGLIIELTHLDFKPKRDLNVLIYSITTRIFDTSREIVPQHFKPFQR